MLVKQWFIGWDVGGWNCDKNPKSRDAIVILDANRKLVGRPWRGNLRKVINKHSTTYDWVVELFKLCRSDISLKDSSVTLAIDTPLGFSEAFLQLATETKPVTSIEESCTNPYLFRRTERFLFEHGHTPLSAIKDMIGSQATKGMHVLACYAPKVIDCGVWGDGSLLTAIESYPSPCEKSVLIKYLRKPYFELGHSDFEDALTCALVASLFAQRREDVVPPEDNSSNRGGWIWIATDALSRARVG